MNHNLILKYLYGPVSSWRLGKSLGIDLISTKDKACNFDCSYCQIGRTKDFVEERKNFVNTDEVIKELNMFFDENKDILKIDFLTFSGRGEPTLAKNLGEIISYLKNNSKFNDTKLALITNSSLLNSKVLQQEIKDLDVVIAKFDVWDAKYLKKINNPVRSVKFEEIFDGLKSFRKIFKGELELQIMFTAANKNNYENIFDLIKQIKPDVLHINTPLRPCEIQPLDKIEIENIKQEFIYHLKGLKDLKILSVYDAKKEKIIPISSKDTILRRGKE